MLNSVTAGAITFVVIFGVLRGIEALYHRLRHTPDWSPHWGSWLFAVLGGLYIVISDLGR